MEMPARSLQFRLIGTVMRWSENIQRHFSQPMRICFYQAENIFVAVVLFNLNNNLCITLVGFGQWCWNVASIFIHEAESETTSHEPVTWARGLRLFFVFAHFFWYQWTRPRQSLNINGHKKLFSFDKMRRPLLLSIFVLVKEFLLENVDPQKNHLRVFGEGKIRDEIKRVHRLIFCESRARRWNGNRSKRRSVWFVYSQSHVSD